MATIPETTATQQAMIDDIADTAIGTGFWSEGDSDFNNDGSNSDWWNNARVIQNNATGEYLLFYAVRFGDGPADRIGNPINGIRIIRSTEWNKDTSTFSDGAPGSPSGNTTVAENDDDMDGNVPSSSWRRNSFTALVREEPSDDNVNSPAGLWTGLDETGMSENVRYFGSVGEHYIVLAAWSNENVRDDGGGEASFYGYENVQNEFYNHGVTPTVATYTRYSVRGDYGDEEFPYPCTGWAWNTKFINNPSANHNMEYSGQVGATQGSVGTGAWGFQNPVPGDGTFFYRRPAVYSSSEQLVPLAELTSALPSKWGEGMSHGDTVTVDGITYRGLEQRGDSDGTIEARHILKVGLRYE